ncbi:unnamed protein product [Urochloa decumbens]|uniref:Glycosyltransferase n=1 Tax=Urochloa decumbens TaxID=240449 RepID=A0ABC9ADG7_9POAL
MGTDSDPAPTPAPGKQPPAAHVVLLASPGAGHVLPMAELARRVVAHGEFTATLVTYANFSSAGHGFPSALMATLPPSVSAAVLPEVPLDDLPADARIETRILTVVERSLPNLRDLLASSSPPGGGGGGVAAFVPDIFGAWALELSAELGVPGYVFCTTNLMALHSLLHTPELDRTTTCEFGDLPEPVRLPGCVPLRGADLVDPLQDRADPAYHFLVDLAKRYLLADGFIVNTFDAMEHEAIAAFETLSRDGVYPPAYAVGPFARTCSSGGQKAEHRCLRWLDEQPDRSVLYVCFGSGGTLSTEQMAELAAGLEASGHKFLWVVRFPSDKDRSASFFGGGHGHSDDPLSYLPEGFVKRTRGVGLAVEEWAPQVEVLSHRAVGGFVSHCGWNSTLEAVAAGVPMLAWPLYAEQRVNAVMLAERVGLALRPRGDNDDGVVTREEVAAAVTELMVGEKGAAAREKARELREAAAEAWALDGTSRKAFEAVAGEWKKAAAVRSRGAS